MDRVTKAVIPAAGLGTRFLPAAKAIPKEMLPAVDKPTIQYVVEEAASAGLTDLLVVTGRGKGAIEDHFDNARELEQALAAKGAEERLARVRASAELASMHYVRQREPLGLGHAVYCAAAHVCGEPFAVLLGDDFIDVRDQLLPRMMEVRERYGGSVVALMEVPAEQVSLYGSAVVEETADADVLRVTDLVEKPSPEEAPSRFVVVGRYVLDPAAFEVLAHTGPDRGGEIQLTDALLELARRPEEAGGGVHGVLFRGRRYDTGNKLDYLRTTVRLACDRDDVGPEFLAWLQDFLAQRTGTQGAGEGDGPGSGSRASAGAEVR